MSHDVLWREGESKPERIAKAYKGDRDYIAMSYARADGDIARSIVCALADAGYRLWWDEDIRGGARFSDDIADRVHDCTCVVALFSRAWVASAWCRDEVEYALGLNKKILPIYLEDVELPRAIRMRLGGLQALFWHEYESDEEFNEDLFAVRMLDSCLTDEGKSARGVKARNAVVSETDSITDLGATEANTAKGPEAEANEDNPVLTTQQTKSSSGEQDGETRWCFKLSRVAVIVAGTLFWFLIASLIGYAIWNWDNSHQDDIDETSLAMTELLIDGSVQGVKVRGELDDYGWDELKALSRAIASSRNNEDGMEIASEYHLVDIDGKLQGDEKVVTLDDGKRTSIRILGFRHDELVGGGMAGITFEFADAPAIGWMNEPFTNGGGWEKCMMRAWLNSDFASRMPSGLQSCIEAVKKRRTTSGWSSPRMAYRW